MTGKSFLYSAFESAMLDYPLKDVSVRKLVDTAGVNRNTFYYHFNDLDEFITAYLNDSVIAAVLNNIKEFKFQDAYAILCEYIVGHKELLMKMLDDEKGSSILLSVCHDALYKEFQEVIHKYERILRITFTPDTLNYLAELLTVEYTNTIMRICFMNIDVKLLKKFFAIYLDNFPDVLKKVSN